MRGTRISLVTLLLLAVLSLLLTGCGRKGVMTINGEKVTKDEFYQRLEEVPVQTQTGNEMAGIYVIKQIINEKLVQQLAKEKGKTPTEAQINKKIEFIKKESGGNIQKVLSKNGMTMDDLKRKITIEQSFVNVASNGVNITDAEVKKTYEDTLNAKNSPFKKPERVLISAVVVKSKEKIDKAYKMLKEGNEFGTVAMQLSDSPVAKSSQGVLGEISQDMEMVPKLVRTTTFSLEKGKYSKPILVDKDWMIIKADKRFEAKVQKFEDVKDMIKEQLAVRKGLEGNKYAKELAKFVQAADIKVNKERYKGIPDMIKKETAKTMEAANKAAAGATVLPTK